ncbi:hypothetical protein HY523_01225 [Candidatus Berkelbacteria bacterium]|nr:hypothetical protein [Candidatus Berkelbacteria bacterium]
MTDSLFEHRQDFSGHYTLEARDHAAVIVLNSTIRSSAWLNWNFYDAASLKLDNVEQIFSGIWHSFQGQASAVVKRAKFHGTLNHEVRFAIEDSPDTFIEFVYPPGAVVDEEFPRRITDYTFPNAGEENIASRLTIKNSTARSWGITVNPGSSVAIKNTDSLIVTFAISEPWQGITAELNDLKAKRYDDQTWQIADASLRLQNTTTGRWSPIVGGTNTLIVKNSDLADNAFSSGEAKVVIEHSTASFLKAKDSVEMTVKDSVVSGDVVAVDNGRITLVNSKVKGKVIEEGNGKVTKLTDD